MTVQDTLMGTGAWSLRLKPETPLTVRDALDWTLNAAAGYGHLMVFSTRVNAADMTSADRLTSSRFTGVLLEWSDEYTIAGAGPAWWLGDSNGAGAIISSPITGTAASLTTWIGNIRPSSLNAGTVTDPGGTATGSYVYVTRRAALEAICDAFGVEWQVTPSLKLNVGVATALWSSTPTAFVLPNFEGRDAGLSGLDSMGVQRSMDLREFANTVYVLGNSTIASDTDTALYTDINGNSVTRAVVVNASSSAPGTEGTVATTELAVRYQTRRHVVLNSMSHDIAGDISTGGYVYVYDPRLGLQDVNNEQYFAGQVTWPLKMRVMSQTWPIREGYGVWFRDSTGTMTDLTDWFVPETGAASVEFGSIQRTLSNNTGLVGTTDSGKLENQISYGEWINWTPQLRQNGSNVNSTVTRARYRRNGSSVEFFLHIQATASGSAGTDVDVSLPITANDSGYALGPFWLSRGGTHYIGSGYMASTSTAKGFTHASTGAIGSNGPSLTVTSGDEIRLSGTYEAAH